jgi:myo-inositol-1(or 4)-monophosphatase
MSTGFGIEWLHPELDRCRDLIAHRSSARNWTKPLTGGGTELVSEIDLAVERLLREAIYERLPDAAILSEESLPNPSALECETCFVIDPIDGTDELVAGRPGFAISIALFRDREPAAALLDLPAHDRRFECAAGTGTYLNGRSVRLSEVKSLSEARLAVSATQHRMEPLQPFWESVGAARLLPTPAFTPKFAAVLAGDCDAALYLPVRPHRTAIWDYAAAGLLLAEAGGWFGSTDGVDLLQRRPFAYTGGWVATPRGLRDQLLSVAQRLSELPDVNPPPSQR